MELLAGQTPSGVKIATTELSHLPSLPSGVPAGIPAELLTRRADIVAALARIHAANLSIAEADAACCRAWGYRLPPGLPAMN